MDNPLGPRYYFPIMASERTQRQLERLLDEAEEAFVQDDWGRVSDRAHRALLLDPENRDAVNFLAAAERALGSSPPPATGQSIISTPPATSDHPASFAGGRYQVKKLLGEGGKKKVYLAHDTTLDREVAFALIKTEGLDDTSRIRIQREAQAMGRLGSHPHIVTVFDLGQEPSSAGDGSGQGQPYMVTELMGGGDVEGLIEDANGHRLALDQAIKIAQETCSGLEFAHGRGIVHRDLKPGNVWLTEDGIAKIGDFGLAVALDRSRLTTEGMMVGTVSYMPPEQAMGGDVTPQSDLYSLGAMLYEMVTGRPPFLGDDTVAIIGQHINTPPVAPIWHNSACPRALDALILRMLAKDPSERPGSASDVLAALKGIDLTEPPLGKGGPTEGDDAHALDSLAGGVFVGRQREMSELKGCLEDALSGRGRLVMLVGEPGIGKTRTVQELATYATLRGAQVLWGRCYEEQGMPPYWPWVQAIRSYVREKDPQQLRSEMAAGAADIAEIVSDVRESLPDLGPPPALENAEQARFRLFDSITTFLKAASQKQPLVLALDDLHWADKPSLLLLQFVARELGGGRLLLVGTYRDMELSRQHPLAECLGELSRERLFQRVLLRGLAQEDVERFIEVATGTAPPRGLASAVYAQTEGNPLFVTEAVRLLAQEGQLAAHSSTPGRPGGEQESWNVRIPEGVKEVLGRRLNRLSDRCNQALTVASIIGREFSLAQLQRLMDIPSVSPAGRLSEDRLLEVLDEALAGRIVEELPRTAGVYQFTHGLIHELLASELSATRKVRLHRQIGQVLEELYGTRLEPRLAELAHHFWEGARSGDIDKAVDYTRRAAERATSLLAYEEACQFYEKALQALELEEGSDQPQFCDLLLALGQAQAKTGDFERARDTFQRVAASARQLGSTQQLALAAVGFEDASWRPGLPGEPAVSLLKESLDVLPPEDELQRARVLGALARALSFTSSGEGAEALAYEAIELARRVDDYGVLVANLKAATLSLRQRPEQIHERLELYNELLRLAAESGDREAAMEGYGGRILELVELGDTQTLDADIQKLTTLAEEAREPHHQYVAAAWRAMRALLHGRFNEAEELAQQAMALGQRLQAEGVAGNFGLQMFTIRKEQGRLRELEPLVKSFVDQHSASSAWRQGLALIYRELGREPEARAEFEHFAVNDFADIPKGALWLTSLAYLSEVCVFLQDADRAAILYRLLLPYDQRTISVGAAFACYGAVARYLGMLSGAMSDWDNAERHFQDALTINSRMGARPYLAHTQQQYAEMLLTRGRPGDRELAMPLLNQAMATARELGMQPLMERILARRDILTA